MPFDSNGVFTRVMNWTSDQQNGIAIECGRHDQEDDNFAQGFNDTFCRDGRAAATGDFRMGTHKIQNLGNATASTDAVNKGQMDTALATKQATITGAATTIVSSNLTANKALIADGSGKVAASAVTSTELGYMSGVTSAVQTQINNLSTTMTPLYIRNEMNTVDYTSTLKDGVNVSHNGILVITTNEGDYTLSWGTNGQYSTVCGGRGGNYASRDSFTFPIAQGTYIKLSADPKKAILYY